MSGGARYQGFVPGRHLIDAYGNGGFRFADMSHRGSILALPSGVHAWAVQGPEDLTPEAFAPVVAEAGTISVLLLGTGETFAFVPDGVRALLREAGISVDAMQTGAAARTYNVMAAENRPVAAALIAVA
ncbi:MTH938/NDUFAF3 family protein [uncultured Alsobacter sp.]|uniref:Mth938-like domain-containing protein n=1 Tax=uncultured Alsobacter sp. TaxID=1748258 RepID=UPI0025CBB6AB|nr:MTH938/NDUFAF3 family protein [uncultured Alsobacter sp.]